MIRMGFIIILQLTIYVVSISQWVNIYTEQSSYYLSFYSVYFTSESTGYVVRGDSAIIKTTNGGLNWLSLNGTSGYNLTDIQFTSINTGYALGDNFLNRIGFLLKTTNSGTNWSVINFSDITLNSLKFIDDTVGYILTDSNFVYKTINGGMNWATQSLNGNFLTSFDFVDANTGFVSGYYAKFYKTTNGGNNWISSSGPDNIGLDFVDANIGYSTVFNTILSSNIIKTTNGGSNWFIIYTRDSTFLGDPFFLNVSTGWVIGSKVRSNNIQYRMILKTTNGGIDWFEQSTSLQPDSSSCLSSIFMVNSNTGYATTLFCSSSGTDLNGKIFKTTNGGGEPIGFEPVYSNIPESYLLHQNYPNPFNPVTKINFEIPVNIANASVSLIIYDITGKIVSVLVDEELQPGKYEIEWNAGNFTSGVYFYTLRSSNFKETKKMLMIK